MLNKKITTTFLALLCVLSMAFAAVAPVLTPAVEGVQVACDFGHIEDWV